MNAMKGLLLIALVYALLLADTHATNHGSLNSLALTRMFTSAHKERMQSLASKVAPGEHNHELNAFADRMIEQSLPPMVGRFAPQGPHQVAPLPQMVQRPAQFPNQMPVQQQQPFVQTHARASVVPGPVFNQQPQFQQPQFQQPQFTNVASAPPLIMQNNNRFSPQAAAVSNTAETGILVANKILQDK